MALTGFLVLTGWRPDEAFSLRWGYVDLPRRTALLPITKTDRSIRSLSQAACDILIGIGRGDPDALVVPSERGGVEMIGYRTTFDRILAMGGLPVRERRMTPVPKGVKAATTKRQTIIVKPAEGAAPLVTPYTFRHSFASLASDLGYSDSTIAPLVGHATHHTTGRYIHSADSVLLAAAHQVANEVLARMTASPAEVVQLHARMAGAAA